MTVELEGGTRISDLREGEPFRQGTLALWRRFGRDSGARAISLRVLEFSRGLSPGLRNAACEEVLYALEGRATVLLDRRPHDVPAGTGIHLAPGVLLAVDNAGPAPLVLAGSRCPDPGGRDDGIVSSLERLPASDPVVPALPPLARLEDRAVVATGDRWYRVLVEGGSGGAAVTQFVGSIPPGRAPDHLHHYEEVLCVLSGQGVMWAGTTSAPIGPGSCIFLPRGQTHCVENTGVRELRLLGVFYPAGSPAARYDARPGG